MYLPRQRDLRQSEPSPPPGVGKTGVARPAHSSRKRVHWACRVVAAPFARGPRGRDTLELLQVLPDDLVCRLYIGHAAVDTGGQARELDVRAAPTGGIQVAVERSPNGSQGLRPASAGRLERSALIVME